jgi:hypothetical protein
MELMRRNDRLTTTTLETPRMLGELSDCTHLTCVKSRRDSQVVLMSNNYRVTTKTHM